MVGERRRVFAIGNALVDLEIQVGESLLAELGFDKGLMTLVDAPTQQRVLQASSGLSVHRSSGGSAANTAVGVAELGGEASFCGKVAADELGEFYRSDLDRIGVPMGGSPATDGVTGTSVVLITPDAQRTMLTHLGVAGALEPADVRREDLEGCAWVYVEGYLLFGDPTRAAALRAVEIARELGIPVALTASDPSVVEACRGVFDELLAGRVDLLFCNELESRALTGEPDPEAAGRKLAALVPNVALTMGPAGSLLLHDGELLRIGGVAVDEVDTTGAGDMYAAGVLYGLTAGVPWPVFGRIASSAAARVVGQLGARLSRKLSSEEIRALAAIDG